jgi:hypothetical protein
MTAILRVCEDWQLHFHQATADRAAKRCRFFDFVPGLYHSFFPSLSAKYLLPNPKIDVLFGLLLPTLSPLEATAGALTLLTQFDVAERLYQTEEISNDFIEKLKGINSHFVVPPSIIIDLDKLLKPLATESDRPELNELSIAVNNFAHGILAPVPEALDVVQQGAIRSHFWSSSKVFAREVLAVVESLLWIIRRRLAGSDLPTDIPIFSKLLRSNCLNPVFLTLIQNFDRLIAGLPPARIASISSMSTPSILLSPSMIHELPIVSNLTARGLVGLGELEINEYFSEVAEKANDNRMDDQRWQNFAPFCFSVFCAQPTIQCFSIAFSSYCHVFTGTQNVPLFHRQEAAARILTLIRIAISKAKFSDEWLERIRSAGWIFRKNYAEVWRFWLQEIVALAREGWFFEIAIDLFTEMAYRSSLYAKKYGTPQLQAALQNLYLPAKGPGPIAIMDRLETFCQAIMEINFTELRRQANLHDFILESLGLETLPEDLMELRNRQIALSPFEKTLRTLPKSTIKKMGNFEEFVQQVAAMTESEREFLIRDLTGSSSLLSEQMSHFHSLVSQFNMELPFVFPIRFESSPQISIFRISTDFATLSPELLAFRATTSVESDYTFLLQKSMNPRGLRPCVTTFSTVLTLFRQILQFSYPSRQRNIQLSGLYSFEVGPRMVLVALQSDVFSLNQLFEADVMYTREKWLLKYVSDNTLTEKGRSRVSEFPGNSLSLFITKSMSVKSFLGARLALGRSAAATGLMRHIFGLPYSALERTLIAPKTGEVPIVQTDFDVLQFTGGGHGSSVRLSPNIMNVLGKTGVGELVLALSAVAHALTSHFESVRTYLEMLLSDLVLENVGLDVEGLMRERSRIEYRFVGIAPPSSSTATTDECLMWMETIRALINDAQNAEIQPLLAMPWY